TYDQAESPSACGLYFKPVSRAATCGTCALWFGISWIRRTGGFDLFFPFSPSAPRLGLPRIGHYLRRTGEALG
ncbi:hypothetical protein M9458_056638, partial [Cirrhinus mrigala]